MIEKIFCWASLVACLLVIGTSCLWASDYPVKSTSDVKITRIGSQPSVKGPAEYFTGVVRVDSPFKGSEPARVSGAMVTFEPGTCLALTSARPDADHYGRSRFNPSMGRSDTGNEAGRHCLDSSRSQALPWSHDDNRHDSHCHSGDPRGQSGRLDGKSQ